MSFDIKQLQKCQFELLKELKRVCYTNGIQFFLAYGSCLGAIRHSGFIPWDDDIDVCMTNEDFEKLKKSAGEFAPGFFLQTHETDRGYGLMIGRLRNSETTLIENDESDRDINHGVFIDIYPLFNSPKNKINRRKYIVFSMIYRLLLYGEVPKNHGKVMKMGSMVLLKVIPFKLREKLIKYAYKVISGCEVTGEVSTFYGDEVSVNYKVEKLFPVKEVMFEGELMPVPSDADEYLKFTYGDYMQLPPEEKRVVHHNYKLVDLNCGYQKYKGTLYCVSKVKK